MLLWCRSCGCRQGMLLTAAIVGFDDWGCLGEIEMDTGLESQGGKISPVGIFPRIERLMNPVPKNMTTAKLGTMADQAWTHSASKRIWRSILPSMCKGCCLNVGRFGSFWHWIGWFPFGGSRDLLTRLSPDLASRRDRTVCTINKATPKDSWSFYFGFAKISISDFVAVKGSSPWKHSAEGQFFLDNDGFIGFATDKNEKGAGF